MNGIKHFDQIWNFRRANSYYEPNSRCYPWIKHNLVCNEQDAREVYYNFLQFYRLEAKGKLRPTSAYFDKGCLIGQELPDDARHAVENSDCLTLIEEFSVSVWSQVQGCGLIDRLLGLSFMCSQSDLYIVPVEMNWCLAWDGAGMWWYLQRENNDAGCPALTRQGKAGRPAADTSD